VQHITRIVQHATLDIKSTDMMHEMPELFCTRKSMHLHLGLHGTIQIVYYHRVVLLCKFLVVIM